MNDFVPMFKRVGVEHLRLGMFIHEFCGSWMDHPFWRTAFLLEDPADIQRIRDSSIHEVWIDTARGLDVAADTPDAKDAAEVEQDIDATLQASADQPLALDAVPDAALAAAHQPTSVTEEIQHARRTCKRARSAVVHMFNEVRMGRALDADATLPLVDEISDSVLRNPGALISLARLKDKDDYTYMHSVAVCALMVSLARRLALSPDLVRQAGLAGLLHDLGKATIPLEILNKPGKLTEAEFETMRGHPAAGHAMLREGKGVGNIPLDVCLHHHEKVDGRGYPDGLKDEEISLFAKMGAVCDVYDAITSNRPYKAGWEPADSIRRMASWKDHFDPRIFQAFVKSIGIYPVGSLVKLGSGVLGVVAEQNMQSLLTPVVKVFFSATGKHQIKPYTVDLGHAACKDRIISHEDPAVWGLEHIERFLE